MSVGPRNRRRDVRRELPLLTVQLGEVQFLTRDWSLGGFSMRDDGQAGQGFEAEEEVSGTFVMDGADGAYPFGAVVVRANPDTKVVAFRFLELASDTFWVLERMLLRAEPNLRRPARAEATATQAATQPAPGGITNWFTRWRSRLIP
ncbi:MAG: PilZ domain-containing protein [Rhodospirillaceae bacterium]|nr:PilZ domain-containing protein [Rhodospirillaceae bacterium]